MLVLHIYLQAENGNIVGSLCYIHEDDKEVVSAREFVLSYRPERTEDDIKQEILGILEKEQYEYAENGPFDIPSGATYHTID